MYHHLDIGKSWISRLNTTLYLYSVHIYINHGEITSFTSCPHSTRLPPHHLCAAANVELRDAGIVVADLAGVRLPGVEVEVLKLGVLAEGLAGVHVVEGLAVHVKQVAVALLGRGVDHVVHVHEARLLGKDAHRLDLGKLVKVARGDDARLGVPGEDLGNEGLVYVSFGVLLVRAIMKTYSSSLVLAGALLNALVHRRTLVAVEGGRAAFAAHVHVDGEERLAPFLDRLPLRDERLAAVIVGRVGGVDAAGVVFERRAVDDLVGVGAAALVGLVELEHVNAVQVGLADVATGLAAVFVVDGRDLGEVVGDAGGRQERVGEGSKGEAGRGDAIVSRARIVLDLLQENEIRQAELVDKLVNNAGQMGRVRSEVLSVVRGDGDALTVTSAVEGHRRELGVGLGRGRNSREGKQTVEAKGIGDNTGNITQVVAELGVAGVLGAIERSADDDGLRIGICGISSRLPNSSMFDSPPSSIVIPPCALTPVVFQSPRTQTSPNLLGRLVW